MFIKNKVYYTVELEEDGTFLFICSFATFNEANDKVEQLKEQNGNSNYRILRIEKNIEEVS